MVSGISRVVVLVAALLMLPLNGAGAAETLLPALIVEQVSVSNAEAMAEAVQAINTRMREAHDVALFLRFYQQESIGELATAGFLLSPAADFASLLENNRLYSEDPVLREARELLYEAVLPDPPVYLKAVRFDGTNAPGWLSNMLVQAADEDALLAAVDSLVGRMKADSLVLLVNVFRVMAGERGFSHLVSFNTATRAELGALLDAMVRMQLEAGNLRIVSNHLYQELVAQ